MISYQEQSETHGSKFKQLSSWLDQLKAGVDLSSNPSAVIPERALVFELNSSASTFQSRANDLAFEWLFAETKDLDESDNEDDATEVLYVTIPSMAGLNKIQANWKLFISGKKNESREETALWELFKHLKDIRPWSAEDRIDKALQRYIKSILEKDKSHTVILEINLWFRDSEESRKNARELLENLLNEVEGEELDFVSIPEIRYEAALISVPAPIAKQLAERNGKLANSDSVMAIRPQSVFSSTPSPATNDSLPKFLGSEEMDDDPIAAILDGYPTTAHPALVGRIVVHEVDVTSRQATALARCHGTAMASLVLHGDLHKPDSFALKNKLVIVPVLTATKMGESIPLDKLPIGVIYRAILALVGSKAKPGFSPKLVIVNHSICDESYPFVRRASPWASLIDYFSHYFQLLFIVSAGNIRSGFTLEDCKNKDEFLAKDEIQREATIVLSYEQATGTRGLLSPAEAINAVTVGALHADEGPTRSGYSLDPFPNIEMPNLCSALGLGINRGVKPDVLENGGKMLGVLANTSGGLKIRGADTPHVGQLVASPDPSGQNPSYFTTAAGTSNAAAITTRNAIRIAETMRRLFLITHEDWHLRPTRAVMLKALLAHGCEWGKTGQRLEEVYKLSYQDWHPRRQVITRFLGYGKPNIQRVLQGADHQITLLAEDVIVSEELHIYRIPIPKDMIGSKELRRITLTLAWSTPVVVNSMAYRGIKLQIVNQQGKSGRSTFWKGVGTKTEGALSPPMTANGTLTHLIMEGKNQCSELMDERGLYIGIQAMTPYTNLKKEKVPYALAITLQVAETVKSSSVYVDVKSKIRQPVPVPVRGRIR